ncbi:MAG: CapA family protein [Bacteroidales bacterium]|jgi:poly-gamma-glutamate synthesis protein (capsule biosynthesis protein)|nr:CapA family protein [Bacteroidales bacterium]
MKKLLIILACAVVFFVLFSAKFTPDEEIHQVDVLEVPVVDSLKLIFVGDVMGHGMQLKGAWHDGGDSSYNYFPSLQYVRDYISSADIAIANFEVTLAGEPYEGYPRFSSHSSFAVALKDAGFNVMTLANNHSLDRGKQGLERTIDELDSLGIIHTGTFKDSVSWKNEYPLILEQNNIKLAILNYTYGTNGFPVLKPNIINRIDTVRMAADLSRARELQPDLIITCIHWGEEYENVENAKQRKLASFLAKNGCDLIIGSHPHVVQPFGKIATDSDSVPVLYSLGNFVSNQRWRYSDGGIAFEVNLTKEDSITRIRSYGYEPLWVHRFPDNKVSVFRIIPVNDYLNHPSKYIINEADKKLMMQFYDDTQSTFSRLSFSNFYRTSTYTHLVWQDEFNGEGLPDPEKWSYEQGYVRNNEIQYYTAGRTENVVQRNGHLIITARNDSVTIDGENRPVTSASLISRGKGDWTYGRIEVRAKLPSCLGSWPAIWMMPTTGHYGGWPKSGEIDIMEHVGYDPDKIYFNLHSEKYNHTKNTGRGTSVECPGPDKEFHIYAVEWSAEKIDWFLDEKKVFTVHNNEPGWEAWPFDQPFYLILNFAFGGAWGAQKGVDISALPQEFTIDYVRVFQ